MTLTTFDRNLATGEEDDNVKQFLSTFPVTQKTDIL